MDNSKSIPTVVIRCITYNHEKYIERTLEGFVNQKTSFPFIAIVHDDASTDGTANIIKRYAEKYPSIIHPILETENQYSKKDNSLGEIMNEAVASTKAKYIALCEGDDYWTDPKKLQKQVSFLEENPEYGMCYGVVSRLDERTNNMIDTWGGPNESFDSLLLKNTIPTLTVLVRTSLYLDFYKNILPEKYNWAMGDFPKWLYIANKSKIKFLDTNMGVYRVLPSSASHHKLLSSQLKFNLSGTKIAEFFAKKYSSPIYYKIKNIRRWQELKFRLINESKSYKLKYEIKYLLKIKGMHRKIFIFCSFLLPKIIVTRFITK